MCLERAQPDSFTFSSVLEACSELRDLESGKSIHARVASTGMVELVGTSLVDLYAKCGELEPARSIFDAIQRRNNHDAGYNTQALELYELWCDRWRDDALLWRLLIACPPTALKEFFHLENWELQQYWRRKDAQVYWLDSKERNQIVKRFASISDLHCRCSGGRRANLAGMVATLKTWMHADDPLFSLMICYLISCILLPALTPSLTHAASGGLLIPGYEFLVSMSGDYGIFPDANAMRFEPQALAWTTLLWLD
ncbi:pentatricopeptide repeat-containing protein At4g35130, chloroplastic [Selaginella moellendorffii]|uniref:pentatricopeptide repeat-containing protein At4g35130, chloroplastic n=1 Tax=Selaginella moellendorffii TaxID=88036 RepID=UPI000D1CE69A|nr:pentatricopeptide repeat-containing protein At4g35130, chloroplastic [Selaginella moellendorffii]|eukprot:XP_024533887.1 pentatricopeptide repeat-containing protein At4g35130, chloroplastic [Selaginella moellendorffii]